MHRGTRGSTAGQSMDERLHRALEENKRLKASLNESEAKITRLRTQFHRLVADLKQQGLAVPEVRTTHSPSTSGLLPNLPQVSTATTVDKLKRLSASTTSYGGTRADVAAGAAELALTQNALQQAREEIRRLRARIGTSESSAYAPAPSTLDTSAAVGSNSAREAAERAALVESLQRQLADLTQERNRYLHESNTAQDALRVAREGLARVQNQRVIGATSPHPSMAMQEGLSTLSAQAEANENAVVQLERAHREALATLTSERDALALKLKLLQADHDELVRCQSGVDPQALLRIQTEARHKAADVAVLSSRLEQAQQNTEMLKNECTRLIEELQHSNRCTEEAKGQVRQLQVERGGLEARLLCLTETEMALQKKTEEAMRLEREVLSLTSALHACSRETAAAVDREHAQQVVELTEMREQADALARERQKAVLESQRRCSELERRMTQLQEEAVMRRRDLALSRKECADVSAQLAFAGHAAKDLDDEDVHRALAVAAMMKNRSAVASTGRGVSRKSILSTEAEGGALSGNCEEDARKATDAGKALDLFETLAWDDTWEQGQMREALATAAMDIELAEARCASITSQVEQQREALKQISAERDTLLQENLEMRRRLTHVQTVFAKQQLQAYRSAVAERAKGDSRGGGLIVFCIRGFHLEPDTITAALGMEDASAPTAIFFSLDGLADYATMLSPTLHSLQEAMDIHFQYDDLDPDAVTLATIQQTVFTLQLHRVKGTGSELVAMAELPGMALLASREMAVEEQLTLLSGEGVKAGKVVLEICCSRLMLPTLLAAPLDGAVLMSATEMRGALVALRAVRYLRVQVFRAQGLPSGSDGVPPQPYVFYTAHALPGYLTCVRDTVVRPSGRASSCDPAFDAEPVDHRVVVDRELVQFLLHGSLLFVVFDDRSKEIQSNIGMVEVPLRPLLASPQALIRTTEPLHPQGTLSIGLCWISGP